jgi:hypothetical protein
MIIGLGANSPQWIFRNCRPRILDAGLYDPIAGREELIGGG